MLFAADFETTTYLDENNETRVWAYGLCEIGDTGNFIYGNNMESFLRWCSNPLENHTLYFHNARFDCKFIISYLLRNGFKHVKDRKEFENNSFTTLISDKNQFYSMEICFKKKGKHTNKVTIYDSLKVIPFTVEKIAKDFKLPIKKLEIDYNEKRDKTHTLTAEELAYLKNDVVIMSMALQIMFDMGLDKMTQASNAFSDYKNRVGVKQFEKWFPVPDYDEDIRRTYKGGFTYCDPRVRGKDMGRGIVLDVNSLYPSVMYSKLLPHGEGKYFEGKYSPDKVYPLYTQVIRCQFTLKEGHLPTIQLKGNGSFIPTEYIEDSGEEEQLLYLTCIDLELFFEHYKVYNLEYIDGWKFMAREGMFKDYIDYWVGLKIQAEKDGNNALRTICKLMLNSLYGRFALNPKVSSKYPVLGEDEVVRYKTPKEKYIDEEGNERERIAYEYRNPVYIPVGTFITAYAREITIRSAQKCYKWFCYADTDSLHLTCSIDDVKEILDIDSYALGKWKHEFNFEKARYIRQKSYMEYGADTKKLDEKFWKITCAGMSSRCYEHVTFENFRKGAMYKGKLVPVDVKGGVILRETLFTLKG